jgi:quinohemoprotein ethanol dehydrogenase
VPGQSAVNGCCDVVTRGVAEWNGKVYVATLDGRLVALSAATGRPIWDVRTTDADSRYTNTGAPRIVKGKVLIGKVARRWAFADSFPPTMQRPAG